MRSSEFVMATNMRISVYISACKGQCGIFWLIIAVCYTYTHASGKDKRYRFPDSGGWTGKPGWMPDNCYRFTNGDQDWEWGCRGVSQRTRPTSLNLLRKSLMTQITRNRAVNPFIESWCKTWSDMCISQLEQLLAKASPLVTVLCGHWNDYFML